MVSADKMKGSARVKPSVTEPGDEVRTAECQGERRQIKGVSRALTRTRANTTCGPTLVECWANAGDVDPALNQQWHKVRFLS